MATAVTPAATTNSPTMIDAASRDAHSSSALDDERVAQRAVAQATRG